MGEQKETIICFERYRGRKGKAFGKMFKNTDKLGSDTDIKDVSTEKKCEIEEKVSEILKENGFTTNLKRHNPTIDIVTLVRNHGFAVQSVHMDKDTTGILIVKDGKTVLDTGKDKLIAVNADFDNPDNDEDVIFKKSRFITAHEYGHYVLHKKEGIPMYAHRDTAHRTDPIELEADYFARAILMPLKIFSIYVKAIDNIAPSMKEDERISILSKSFKTTKNKVAKRIKDINEMENTTWLAETTANKF